MAEELPIEVTSNLRFVKRDSGFILQQEVVFWNGRTEWQDVPTVEETVAR